MADSDKQIHTVVNIAPNNRNRLTVLFRGILVVPVAFFVASFSALVHVGIYSTGVLVLPVFLALLFRGVYPSYVLTFNHAILELNTRLLAYLFLLNDDYPSIERNPNVALLFPDIDGGKRLNRYLPLVKWLFAIPLYIVGCVYILISIVAWLWAWVAILFTGLMPTWTSRTLLGTLAFWNRVTGYMIVLTTDEYPSFTL